MKELIIVVAQIADAARHILVQENAFEYVVRKMVAIFFSTSMCWNVHAD